MSVKLRILISFHDGAEAGCQLKAVRKCRPAGRGTNSATNIHRHHKCRTASGGTNSATKAHMHHKCRTVCGGTDSATNAHTHHKCKTAGGGTNSATNAHTHHKCKTARGGTNSATNAHMHHKCGINSALTWSSSVPLAERLDLIFCPGTMISSCRKFLYAALRQAHRLPGFFLLSLVNSL